MGSKLRSGILILLLLPFVHGLPGCSAPGGGGGGSSGNGVPPTRQQDLIILESITPASGPVGGGIPVQIRGQNFDQISEVRIGGVLATSVVVVSSRSITATLPAGTGAGLANVRVVSGTNGTETLVGGFTYLPGAIFVQVDPASGPVSGGTRITITGANFERLTSVTLGGAAVTEVNVSSPGVITGVTPPSFVAGLADLVIVSETRGTLVVTGAFEYLAGARVTGISPASGPRTGGTVVTVTGDGFTENGVPVVTRVSLGGVDLTGLQVVDRSTVRGTTAASGVAGTVDVTVFLTNGSSGTLTGAFTYNPSMAVTVVAPGSGPLTGGTPITITGSAFADVTSVTLGGDLLLSTVLVNGTTITGVTPPAFSTGARTVTVSSSTRGSASLAGGFTYLTPAPVITSVAPTQGPQGGGTAITLTGRNFTGVTGVNIGTTPLSSFLVQDPTRITGVTGPAATAGTFNVDVVSTNGTGSRLLGYTYNPTVTLTAISPANGPVTGSTNVTLTGANFVNVTSVTIGGQVLTGFDVVDTSTITGTTPAVPSSRRVDVTVVSSTHGSATLASAFNYSLADASSTLPAGIGPRSPVVADFDRDGSLDLVVADTTGNTIVLFSGNGDGTFAPIGNANPGIAPQQLITGDFDLDSEPDILAIDLLNPNLFFLPGNGGGGFDAAVLSAIPNGELPLGIVSAEFSGDGALDLLVVTSSQNAHLMLGDGLGGFTQNASVALGLAPQSPVAGDHDRDGRVDFVIGATDQDRIAILRGDGVGGVTSTVTQTIDNRPTSLISQDLDPDARLDLVSLGDNQAAFLFGTGAATFATGGAVVAGNTEPRGLSVDLDRDGSLDLVVTDFANGTVTVSLGNGNRIFGGADPIPAGTNPSGVASGDFDRDGDVDLAVTNLGTGTVSIFLGTAAPDAFTFRAGLCDDTGDDPRGLVVCDINRDGLPDVVTANESSQNLSVLTGNAAGSLNSPLTIAVNDAGAQPVAVGAGDFDHNGRIDLAVATNNARVTIFLGNGDGTFSSEATLNIAGGGTSRDVAIADFDGAGNLDLVVADPANDEIMVFIGNGDGTFNAGLSFTTGAGSDPQQLVLVDLDRNGSMDLVAANSGTANVACLVNDGTGDFSGVAFVAAGSGPIDVDVADFDRNGILDLAVLNQTASTVTLHSGTGVAPFFGAPFATLTTETTALSVLARDLDSDGRPDIAVTTEGQPGVHLFRASGDTTFFPRETLSTGDEPAALGAADLDQNGSLDLLVSDRGSEDLCVFGQDP